MNHISHWNPVLPAWRASDPFEAANRLFDESFNQLMEWGGERGNFLPVDVIEQDDAYIIHASIPGIAPDALDVTFLDNVLTIRGESEFEIEQPQERYLLRERRSGSFTRRLIFPAAVDADHIEATCAGGELMLRLPKANAARPRRIPIDGAGDAHVIENRSAGGHAGAKPESHGWAEGQAQLPVEAEPTSEGWAEGQAQLPNEAEPESHGWAEGQAQLPVEAEPTSEGWAEGQATL